MPIKSLSKHDSMSINVGNLVGKVWWSLGVWLTIYGIVLMLWYFPHSGIFSRNNWLIFIVLLTGGFTVGIVFRDGSISKCVVLGVSEAVITGVIHLGVSHLDIKVDWGAATNGWMVLIILFLPICMTANLLGCVVGIVSLKLRRQLTVVGTSEPSEDR